MDARRRLAFTVAVSIALLVPLAVFGGSGFAKGLSSAAAQYQYGKVTVCHKTHSAKNPGVTITIGAKAAAKMIAAGKATPGPCSPSTNKPGNQSPGNSGGHGNSGH
jgi:hypothetical protein